MAHALVTGDPIDGLNIIGPFSTVEGAAEAAKRRRKDYWWTVEMQPASTAASSDLLEAAKTARRLIQAVMENRSDRNLNEADDVLATAIAVAAGEQP